MMIYDPQELNLMIIIVKTSRKNERELLCLRRSFHQNVDQENISVLIRNYHQGTKEVLTAVLVAAHDAALDENLSVEVPIETFNPIDSLALNENLGDIVHSGEAQDEVLTGEVRCVEAHAGVQCVAAHAVTVLHDACADPDRHYRFVIDVHHPHSTGTLSCILMIRQVILQLRLHIQKDLILVLMNIQEVHRDMHILKTHLMLKVMLHPVMNMEGSHKYL